MLNAWAEFWQGLTRETIGDARALCAADLRFVDPFNDLNGIDRFERLLHHMFDTTQDPRFVVSDRAMGAQAGYLRWDFSARLSGRPVTLTGMSEIRFAPDGRVALHHDHWDAGAQVYAQVPVLGAAINLVRRRLSLPAS